MFNYFKRIGSMIINLLVIAFKNCFVYLVEAYRLLTHSFIDNELMEEHRREIGQTKNIVGLQAYETKKIDEGCTDSIGK
jgi:hypothetical protein